jgi:hypothetical protein
VTAGGLPLGFAVAGCSVIGLAAVTAQTGLGLASSQVLLIRPARTPLTKTCRAPGRTGQNKVA